MTGEIVNGGAKQLAGRAIAAVNPQCRYDRTLFLLGHMRAGTTALSNILCSRAEISGYGEAHIAYRDAAALGVLTLNQLRRGSWRPTARRLFDKVLHNRYDDVVDPGFPSASAIFIVRRPAPTIASIRRLFDTIGSGEYADDEAAARYYCERMTGLLRLWQRFPADRRIGLTAEQLLAEPEPVLHALTGFLDLSTPLDNSYVSSAASRRRGAGDPLQSGARDRIVASSDRAAAAPVTLDVAPARLAEAEALHSAVMQQFGTAQPARRQEQ